MVALGFVVEFKTCDLHFESTNRPLILSFSNKNELYCIESLLEF